MFDPPPPDPYATGRVVVQKNLVDENDQPVLSELGGIASSSAKPPASPSANRRRPDSTAARSPARPAYAALVIHEVSPPQGFQQAPDTEMNLTKARELVHVANHVTPGPETGPIYTG